MNPLVFLKEVRSEIAKITWPGRQQVVESTILVIIVSIVIGVYVGGLDFVFTSIMERLFK